MVAQDVAPTAQVSPHAIGAGDDQALMLAAFANLIRIFTSTLRHANVSSRILLRHGRAASPTTIMHTDLARARDSEAAKLVGADL
jgi:hypothetical protein